MAEKAMTPRLPFDITDQRTIFYSDTLAGNVLAKQQLREMIKVVLEDEKPDNPIYAAASQDKIFQNLDNDDPLKLIMEKLEKLEIDKSLYSAKNLSHRNNIYETSTYSIDGQLHDVNIDNFPKMLSFLQRYDASVKAISHDSSGFFSFKMKIDSVQLETFINTLRSNFPTRSIRTALVI